MAHHSALLAVLVTLFRVSSSAPVTAANDDCPAVRRYKNVNQTEFVRATWYIQQQQLTGYQPADQLYCVTATYNTGEGSKVPFFGGKVITVHNYANNQSVLCARQPDANDAAKLEVAPCFLPNFLSGAYWILELGTDAEGHYDWMVVSAGQPTVKYADGCTTKEK